MSLFNILFDIAAKTANFESSMTRVERRIDSVASYAKKAGAVLGVAFAANQFRGFVVGAIEAGDQMAKAAQKAGDSVEEFSSLAYAAQLADVQLDSLSKSVQFMQKAIASGNPALREIGIELTDLQRLKPNEQFELIADAIAGIQDPAQRTAAVLKIFGRSGADLLPLFEQGAAGIRKARLEAIELGKVLTKEAAESMQKADDAIKRLRASYEAFAQTVVSKGAPIATGIADSLRTLLGGATELEKLETKLEFLRRFQEDPLAIPLILNIGYDEGSGVVMGPGAIERRIREIQTQIERLKAVGSEEALIPVTISAKRIEAPAPFKKSINPQLMLELQRNFEWIEAEADRAEQQIEDVNRAVKDFMNLADSGIEEGVRESNKNIERQLDAIADRNQGVADEYAVFWERAGQRSFDAVSDLLIDPLNGSIRDFGKNMVDTFKKLLADQATLRLFKLLGSFGEKNAGTGGAAGFFGSIASALFGGYKASGGPLEQNKWYIAGEKGPEPVWGGGAGAFAMGYGGGGGVTVHSPIHIDARGATRDGAEQLIRSMPEILKQHGEAVKADVIQGLRRGRYRI